MKMIWAALAGAVVMFLLGWLIFGMLMMGYYEENCVHYTGLMRDKETMRLWGIALSNLAFAGTLALIFDRWAGVNNMSKGFVAGLLISGGFCLAFDLMMWSTMNLYPYTVIIVDVLVNAIIGGVVGGVVAWVLGMNKKATL